jgi:uncharacterized protein
MNDESNDVSILSGATPDGVKTHKKPRGFACMDPAQVSEIARRGGKAAHASGKAHTWTAETARLAGHKGGTATRAKRQSTSAA